MSENGVDADGAVLPRDGDAGLAGTGGAGGDGASAPPAPAQGDIEATGAEEAPQACVPSKCVARGRMGSSGGEYSGCGALWQGPAQPPAPRSRLPAPLTPHAACHSVPKLLQQPRLRLLRRRGPECATGDASPGTPSDSGDGDAAGDGGTPFDMSCEERSRQYEQARREIFGDAAAEEGGDAAASPPRSPSPGAGQVPDASASFSPRAVAEGAAPAPVGPRDAMVEPWPSAALEAPVAAYGASSRASAGPMLHIPPYPAPRAAGMPWAAPQSPGRLSGPRSLLGPGPWLHRLPCSCANGVLTTFRYVAPATVGHSVSPRAQASQGAAPASPHGAQAARSHPVRTGTADGAAAVAPAAASPRETASRALTAAAPAFCPRSRSAGKKTREREVGVRLRPTASASAGSSGGVGADGGTSGGGHGDSDGDGGDGTGGNGGDGQRKGCRRGRRGGRRARRQPATGGDAAEPAPADGAP